MLEIHFPWSLREQTEEVFGEKKNTVQIIDCSVVDSVSSVKLQVHVQVWVIMRQAKLLWLLWVKVTLKWTGYLCNPWTHGFYSLDLGHMLLMFRHCAKMVWCQLGISSGIPVWDTKQLQPGLSWIRSVWSHVHDSYSTLWTSFQTGVLDHLKSLDKCFLHFPSDVPSIQLSFSIFPANTKRSPVVLLKYLPSYLSFVSCLVVERSVLLADCWFVCLQTSPEFLLIL